LNVNLLYILRDHKGGGEDRKVKLLSIPEHPPFMSWDLFQLVHASILIEVIKAKIFTELDTRYCGNL
jgi:hypothetical protein